MENPTITRTQVLLQGVALEVLQLEGRDTDLAPLVFLHEGLGCVDLWGARGRYWPAELCAATGRAGWVYSRQGYGRSDPIPDVRGHNRHRPDYMHLEALQRLPPDARPRPRRRIWHHGPARRHLCCSTASAPAGTGGLRSQPAPGSARRPHRSA